MKTDTYVEQLLQKYTEEKNLKNVKIQLEKPKHKDFGDLSSNIALQLASPPGPKISRTIHRPSHSETKKQNFSGIRLRQECLPE